MKETHAGKNESGPRCKSHTHNSERNIIPVSNKSVGECLHGKESSCKLVTEKGFMGYQTKYTFLHIFNKQCIHTQYYVLPADCMFTTQMTSCNTSYRILLSPRCALAGNPAGYYRSWGKYCIFQILLVRTYMHAQGDYTK